MSRFICENFDSFFSDCRLFNACDGLASALNMNSPGVKDKKCTNRRINSVKVSGVSV